MMISRWNIKLKSILFSHIFYDFCTSWLCSYPSNKRKFFTKYLTQKQTRKYQTKVTTFLKGNENIKEKFFSDKVLRYIRFSHLDRNCMLSQEVRG